MRKIQLTGELSYKGLTIEQAIANRRSQRDFSGQAMSLAELSHILLYSSGITDKRHGLRAAPSAGATYPIEVYALVNNVEGLSKGIYHYLIPSHELELTYEGDFSHDLSHAALGETMVRHANAALLLSAVFQRTQRRYRERAQRYIFFEAGHIAQNAYLVATSMGLGACAIGAFYDDQVNRLLGLNGRDESALYLIAVGKI
ncbi:MAG: SagB/ThcOx family dehydrogenase [Chloroflexi bacterium]|nr:SagB/ThcOx family dehydrogenase [Chloroflexota bacterium]